MVQGLGPRRFLQFVFPVYLSGTEDLQVHLLLGDRDSG